MKNHTYRYLGILLSSITLLASGCSGKELSYTSAPEATQPAETKVRETQQIIIETEPMAETSTAGESQPRNQQSLSQEIPVSQIDTTVLPDPLHMDIQYVYETSWEDGRMLFNGKAAQIHILGEEYPALQNALLLMNRLNQEDLNRLYNEQLTYAREMRKIDEDFPGFEFERTASVTRADERILSILINEYSWLGGAHPNAYLVGYNYDTASGEPLQLKDVAEDYDAIHNHVLETLKKQESDMGYFADYKETIQRQFYEEPELLQWNMDMNGVTIYFNPYDIAPYAAGRFTIELPFGEYEEWFKKDYVYTGTAYARAVMPYIDYVVDLDGDGTDEKLFMMETTSEEHYGSRLTIDVGQLSADVPLMGYYAQSYLLHTADGRSYLYVESSGDSDVSFLEIFELEPEKINVKGQYPDGALYGHGILDPEKFMLYTRLDSLGTYHGYRSYHLGSDGLPEADEEIYELLNYQIGNDYVITSVIELPVSIDGKEVMMPAGTRFHLRRTDGASFVEAQLDDGRTCRIHYEISGYEKQINGINEFDCFEMLFYAG